MGVNRCMDINEATSRFIAMRDAFGQRRQDGSEEDKIAAAFIKALSHFSTRDGSLKVANQVGGYQVGGS